MFYKLFFALALLTIAVFGARRNIDCASERAVACAKIYKYALKETKALGHSPRHCEDFIKDFCTYDQKLCSKLTAEEIDEVDIACWKQYE